MGGHPPATEVPATEELNCSRANSNVVVAPTITSVINIMSEPDGEAASLRERIQQLDRKIVQLLDREWPEKRRDRQAARNFVQLLGSIDTSLTQNMRGVEELNDPGLEQSIRTELPDLVPTSRKEETSVSAHQDWAVRASKERVTLIGEELLRLHDDRPEISTQLGELLDKIERLYNVLDTGVRGGDEHGMFELGLAIVELLKKVASPEDALTLLNAEFG